LARHRDGAGWWRRPSAHGHLERRSWHCHPNVHALGPCNGDRSRGRHRDPDGNLDSHPDGDSDGNADSGPDGNADSNSH
jgi:hypothetical protein